MTPTAARIVTGPGWHTVRLDSGELTHVYPLNQNDVPEWIEHPMGSGEKRQIVEVIDDVQPTGP